MKIFLLLTSQSARWNPGNKQLWPSRRDKRPSGGCGSFPRGRCPTDHKECCSAPGPCPLATPCRHTAPPPGGRASLVRQGHPGQNHPAVSWHRVNKMSTFWKWSSHKFIFQIITQFEKKKRKNKTKKRTSALMSGIAPYRRRTSSSELRAASALVLAQRETGSDMCSVTLSPRALSHKITQSSALSSLPERRDVSTASMKARLNWEVGAGDKKWEERPAFYKSDKSTHKIF